MVNLYKNCFIKWTDTHKNALCIFFMRMSPLKHMIKHDFHIFSPSVYQSVYKFKAYFCTFDIRYS
jgi:hypothetical protein